MLFNQLCKSVLGLVLCGLSFGLIAPAVSRGADKTADKNASLLQSKDDANARNSSRNMVLQRLYSLLARRPVKLPDVGERQAPTPWFGWRQPDGRPHAIAS